MSDENRSGYEVIHEKVFSVGKTIYRIQAFTTNDFPEPNVSIFRVGKRQVWLSFPIWELQPVIDGLLELKKAYAKVKKDE